MKTGSSRRDFVKAAGVGIVGTAIGVSQATAQSSSRQAGISWGFLMDAHRCKGCLACVTACKTEFEVPLGAFRCAVKEYEHGSFPNTGRAYIPTLCNQCEKPACVEACPTDVVEHTVTGPDGAEVKFQGKAATFKRPDGIVEVDQTNCTGCGKCIDACPYGVRFRHKGVIAGDTPPGKKLNAIDKCNWCLHRLEKNVVPSCVNTCPASARLIGNLNDPDSEISKRLAEHKGNVKVLLRDKGTYPQCFYIRAEVKNLDKAYRDGVCQRDSYEFES